jgi:transposase
LPPYSPDLNPIEKVWSRLKKLLRQAKARSFECLWRTIGEALDQIRPDELRNYFAKCGYATTT